MSALDRRGSRAKNTRWGETYRAVQCTLRTHVYSELAWPRIGNRSPAATSSNRSYIWEPQRRACLSGNRPNSAQKRPVPNLPPSLCCGRPRHGHHTRLARRGMLGICSLCHANRTFFRNGYLQYHFIWISTRPLRFPRRLSAICQSYSIRTAQKCLSATEMSR